MAITASMVKELRERTGLGMMDCKRALEETGGDLEQAIEELRKKSALKAAKGVPQDMWSCHTMEVEGYIIEGHVPAEAIARLLRERPEGVTGLAVPGMPLGSPGMEMGDRVQPYEVIAFGPDGQKVFASYP